MSVQERKNTNANKLDIESEMILIDSIHEMKERKKLILLEMETHTMTVKIDVHHHIIELVKIQSARLSSSLN